jgi:probable F420-dependent oxidoreductase
MDRPFRFGYQMRTADEADPIAAARRAEAVGFDVVLVSDHVGSGMAPMVTLSAIAQATERIRVGTMVLNHDMRNPVQLAWEASTLDRLSGGRFELGLGAGHTPQEYAATGITLDGPRGRKGRLMEGVEIIRKLLDGETVTYRGEYVHVENASVTRSVQPRLPILVGGNGAALLAHAGAHADAVGLQGLGQTQADGHSHEVKWDSEWLDRQVAQVRAGAGDRIHQVELSALVQVTHVGDDADKVVADVCAQVDGLTPVQAQETPYLLIGPTDEIVRKLHACRERWGISYFVVRECEVFADVLSAVG